MFYGYARVSKEEQNIDMQIDALLAQGIDEVNIYCEKITTRKSERPQLQLLLKTLTAGDTLVIWKLDRLGRTAQELIAMAEDFKKREINLVSLSEHLDTSTAIGAFSFNLLCLLAQMERDVISERTRAGLDAARLRGRVGGRPKVTNRQIEMAVKLHASSQLKTSEILEATGMSRSSYYKYLREHQADNDT